MRVRAGGLSLPQGTLEACRMEGASKEKLASVSDLVTVFENSRYGLVEGGGSPCSPLGPWAVQALQAREQDQGPLGSQ